MASAGDSLELTAAPGTSSKAIRLLLIATCVVGVLVGAVGLLLPQVMGSRDEFGADRQAAITRASDFAVTFNTFSADQKADYHRRLKPLMTTSFHRKTVEITNQLFDIVKDRKQSSGDVRVISVAVDRIDRGSASVIIAFDSAVRRGDSEQALSRSFRWRVDLKKTRGEWLVNQAEDVPPVEATFGSVTDDKSGADR